MFASYFLKRALPFTLTLIVGAALGGVVHLFGTRADNPVSVPRARRHYDCPSSRTYTARPEYPSVVATPVFEPNTRYTREAWNHGVTGVVRLRLTISADGDVTSVETIEGLPYGLTEEAQKVAWRTKFEPARVNGQPVAATQNEDYIFSLSDRMAAGL